MEKFDKDVVNASLKKIVRKDMTLGRKLGVRGVPSIYINGRLAKARSITALSKMVEQELKKKKSQ